jgi:phytoene synthase
MALVKNISLIKKNSKTFYLASAFLPHNIKRKVLEVYAFCRLYDDIVDLKLDNNLDNLQPKIKHLNLNAKVIEQIKVGIDSDRNFKRYNNIHELIQYSYRVAGCVGLIMCELLKVKNLKHKYHAIDLGIAMQLTNICRDISEDLINGRVYIPKTMLPKDNISIKDEAVFICINELLILSEKYYESALCGIKYIPIRSRFSILLALRLYQAIGKKIKINKNKYLVKKINTTKFEKFFILILCFFEFLFMHLLSLRKTQHNPELHEAIKGFPFANEKI